MPAWEVTFTLTCPWRPKVRTTGMFTVPALSLKEYFAAPKASVPGAPATLMVAEVCAPRREKLVGLLNPSTMVPAAVVLRLTVVEAVVAPSAKLTVVGLVKV